MTLRQWSEAKGFPVNGTPPYVVSVLVPYAVMLLSKLFELDDYEVTDVQASKCGQFTVTFRERAVWGDLTH